MKHWRTRGSIKDGRRQPRFVFKKVNKQLISVVGSTLLLVGNYALIPIQVFANETPEITNEQPMSTESELPTLTTSESLPAGTPTDTTTPSTEKPPTADPAPEEPKTEPTTDTTDTDSLEPTEETKEKQLRMPPQAPTDWYAEEENGYMVIKSYNGDKTHITIPSEIDNKPVQIDLKAVLGSYVSGPGAATQTFKIEAAGNSGPVKVTGSFASLFNGNPALTSATFSDADFSEITDMSWMFNGCSSLSSVDVSNWDTANVRNMSNMFRGCSNLSSVDVSSWNTANVTDMSNMFHDCSSLSSVDVSNWNTANVNSMSQMFANCSSLSSLAVSNWNTANVTNMRYMFYSCSNFTSLDISNWDTTNATNMTQMFTNCTKLSELTCSKTFIMATTQALRGLPAAENSGKTTYHWVMDDKKKSYDSTDDLVSGHNGLADTDVHTYTIQKKHAVSFDTDGGSDAPAATTIWDQEVLADPDYKGTKNDHTFIGWKLGDQPYNFTQAVTQPLDLKADWEQAEWVTEDAGTYTRIIGYNGAGENIKVPSMLNGNPVEIDLGAVLDQHLMVTTQTFEIEAAGNGERPVKVTGSFNQLFFFNTKLTSAIFADADISEITDMSHMFSGCVNLSSVNVSKWDTANVKSMNHMFINCSSLSSLDVSNWNTEKVEDLTNVFVGCSSLNSLDVSNWNTANVTNMSGMFARCSSLNSLDVSEWNTGSVEDMYSTFAGCSSLSGVDVSNWNTAKVTNMEDMFSHCGNLTSLDMSNWDTTNVTNMNQMFFSCPKLSELTCSKTFKMSDKQELQGLPAAENSGKTTYHWVVDDRKNSYDSTTDLIDGHNGLSDTKVHTYTIQKKHAVAFDTDGGSDSPSATTIWDKGKVTDPDYKGKKRDHTFIGWKAGDQPYDFTKQVTEPLELKADWEQGEWVTEAAGTYTKIIGYNGTGETIKVPSSLYNKPVEIDLKAVLGQHLGGLSAITKTFEIEAAKNGEKPVKVTGSFNHLFDSNSKLTSAKFADADTSAINDMSWMFYKCSNLSSLDVSNWNTANVTDMSNMFHDCSSLSSVDVSNWNTANVNNMSQMFLNCSSLNSLDASNWNTANVTDMAGMFAFCSNLTSLDMSNWDTANVTYMSQMFFSCDNLSELTCSKSFKMDAGQMLHVLPAAENSGKTTYHWVMDDRKKSYDSTTDLINGHNALSDTKAHTYTIQKKHAIAFDTDGGSDSPSATTIWDKGKVTDPDYKGTKRDHTFIGWKAGDQPYNFSKQVTEPLELKADWKQGEWVTEDAGAYTKIIGYNGTGENIKVPSILYDNPVEIDLGAVLGSSMSGTFAKTKTFEIEAAKNGEEPVKVTGSFDYLFASNMKLASAKFADADTSAITDMNGMFNGCSNLSSVDVSKWDTANMKKMNFMFFSCSSLSSLDVSNWNTEKVEDMRNVFTGCSSLISLDVSNWNTANVTDMAGMFVSCSNLTSLDISNWDTTNGTNMNEMFDYCPKLSELTCSKTFKMATTQALRGLPPAENNGKTTYHWVMDDRKNSYDSTNDLISGHNGLADTDVHTYTIQKKHAVSFDVDGGSDSPSATTIWDKEKVTDPDYKGKKRDHTFIGWKVGGQPYDFTKQVTEPLELKADWKQGEWVTQDAGTYTKIIGYNGTGENIKVPSILYDKPVEIDLKAVLGQHLRGTTKTFEIEESKNGELPVKVTGSFASLFNGNAMLTSAKFADADTSAITDMNGMFNGCNNLSSVDVSNWDTAKVADMSNMFNGCSSLSSLDVSNWNTENVEDMKIIFQNCSSLSSLDVSKWNTANVTDMISMFSGCSSLSSVDVSEWDTTNVMYMTGVFSGCSSLTSLDISNWDTTNGAMRWELFTNCTNLSELTCSKTFKMDTNQKLRDLPTAENNGKTTYHWVMDDRKNSYDSTADLISGHNGLSDTKVHTYTIQKKHAVAFDTDGGSDSPSATTIWDKEKVTDPDYKGTKRDHTFIGWKAGDQPYDFSQTVTQPLELKADWEQGEWVTVDAGTYTKIIGYNGTGENIKVPSILYNKPVQIDLKTVLGSYLRGPSAITKTFEIEPAKNGELPVKLTGSFEYLFNANTKLTSAKFADADTTEITDMGLMFNGCSNLSSVDVSNWNTANVNNMSQMFENCSSLSSLDVSKWNTENVGEMRSTFLNCSSLISLDVSNWNTANVINMNRMFGGCSSLSSLDVSKWNTANVTNMTSMFSGCSSLSSLDVSNWNTANVTDMDYMFSGCSSLSNLDVSNWNTENVLEIQRIFYNCSSLTSLDVSKWNTENVTGTFEMFANCNKLSELTCSKTFKMADNQELRGLPTAENSGKTTYHWVMDDREKSYDSTTDLISGHNGLSDTKAHTYTIQKKHAVAFDVAGGSPEVAAKKVLENKTVTDPNYQGTKANHQFDGWTLDGKPFDFDQAKITAPIQLTAAWRLNQYSIQFDKNGGTGTMQGQTLNYDEEKTLLPNAFNRTGYTFAGWNTQADGQGERSYTDQQAVKNLSAEDGETVTLYAQWRAHTYQIDFDPNTGEGTQASQELRYDQEAKLAENRFTKKGYTFSGWNTQKDGNGKAYKNTETVKNLTAVNDAKITLFAQWTMNTYTITFDSKGGEAVSDKKYTVETETFKLPEQKRKGYTFHGWYDGENKVETIEKGTTGNKALVAKWEAIAYNVTFDSAGGSDVPVQHYTIEKGLTDFTTPTKKGYTFQGWYDGKDKVESIKTGETGDRTLTAKWTMNTYTITFDSKGGEAVSDKKYTVETESFKLPELKRKGYTFHGWYDGETKVETIEKGTTGNKTLVAKWEAVEYNVTFDSAGGSDIPVQHYTIEKGIADFTTPTKKGYTFHGWYDGKDKVEAIKTGETGDRTLTAKWTMNTYTITFDDATLAPITYTVESENIALPKKERLGYTFLGWRVSEETLARAVTDQGQIVQTIPTGTTGNLRLSAQWQANSYEVIVDPNGGSGTRASQRLTYDKAEKLAKNTFTRDGYSFTGWNTQADGKGTAYTDQQEVKNLVAEANGSLTLFAQWKPTKAALEDVIAKEQEANRDKNKYTKESWDTYEKALENAKKVLADANAAPEQIRAALAELTTAIAQLKPIETASGKTSGSTTSPTAAGKTYPTRAKRYPPTGMLTGSGLTIIGVAAVSTALASWKKRNKKD
ncbi:BspA family leucine-rich repeat surface protein (plasmid) [Enterococcus gilvus]|uniref:BspA family leucine-rich repeat surface protein n=1 Tax=Enterococcus gilvus TaxID=160453 RepID=UPI000DF63EF3|nr:BspA family leucine-rich repeat surface protein [Enterococcus gilvus]AXG40413.1 BspA family leucine-rich repeat surface protein [Enterococcus gilvus]